ncbi:hypothetical protein ACFLWY_00925 [Chloroflexota bacterium]
MVNWQVTAATIYCDAVNEVVTVMVYKDMSARCTGYTRYGEPGAEMLGLLKKRSKQVKRPLGCEGLECRRVAQYKEKLMAEEAAKPSRIEAASGD